MNHNAADAAWATFLTQRVGVRASSFQAGIGGLAELVKQRFKDVAANAIM